MYLSRGAPSTTRPPLRCPASKDFTGFGNRANCRKEQKDGERCRNLLGEVGEFWGKAFAPCSGENEMSKPRVEYKTIMVDGNDLLLAEKLNQEADRGWRAHSILPEKHLCTIVLLEREREVS